MTYEQYRSWILSNYPILGSGTHIDLLAGSASGGTAVLCTYPLDLARTKLAYQVCCISCFSSFVCGSAYVSGSVIWNSGFHKIKVYERCRITNQVMKYGLSIERRLIQCHDLLLVCFVNSHE